MPSLKAAIDRASSILGSKAELGRRLGVSPQRITDWYTDIRPCPSHQVAAIARIAGRDPSKLIGDYAIERARKKGCLALARGVLLACLAGAVGTGGYIETAHAQGATPNKGVPHAWSTHSNHYAQWVVRMFAATIRRFFLRLAAVQHAAELDF